MAHRSGQMVMIHRRTLLAGLAAAMLKPNAAPGQAPGKPYRIGVLTVSPLPSFYGFFVEQMGEHGWVEGRDFVVEWRHPEGKTERFDSLATDLVGLKIDLFLTGTTAAALAARRASTTIPIVMVGSGYPVEAGLAASLGRPGGNVTGNTVYAGVEVWGKYLEMLRELLPRARRITLLFDYAPPMFPDGPAALAEARRAAGTLGVSLRLIEVRSREDLSRGLASLPKEPPDALFVTSGPIQGPPDAARQVIDVATRHRLPTMTDIDANLMLAGCLMAYSVDVRALLRRAVSYVDRVLRGAKPGDLPIQQPDRFELIINGKTARALGIAIPQSLLLRADRIIE